PIVTIQLVVSMAFIQRHYEGVTRQMTQGVALDLNLVLDEFEAGTSIPDAMQRAQAVAKQLEITLTLPPSDLAPSEDRFDWYDVAGRAVVATLHEHLATLKAADVTD